MIEGVELIPLRYFEDERGWFLEVRRDSLLPRRTVHTNAFDRETAGTFTVDIGQKNPVAVYISGCHAHGFEALTDLIFWYDVTEGYDPSDPDENGLPWDDPRVRELWSTRSPILSERDEAFS